MTQRYTDGGFWRTADAVYFVTWRLHHSHPELSADERDLVTAALRHFDSQRYELLG